MNPQYIERDEELAAFCEDLADAPFIAFDTEFVSEDTYKPELCLVQVSTDERLAIIDPLRCGNLDLFWQQIVDPEKSIVVHAGREEYLFCYRSTGQLIPNLFDVQLAAAFLGFEYPISYGNLVSKLVGVQLDKHETRSDWRQRPLSSQQLEYAIQDVRDLPELHRQLRRKLESSKRLEWLQGESLERQRQLTETEDQEGWHRLSGVQTLSPPSLATAVALWRWRDEEARRRDVPPRRVLRDDLLIELARRRSSDVRRIASLRGMQYANLRNQLEQISQCIVASRDDEPPAMPQRKRSPKFQPAPMLTQFLAAALASVCRKKKIASSLVGTADDLKDFINYRLRDEERGDAELPNLLQGWRAEIVGSTLDELLRGEAGLRIENPNSEAPLRVDRFE